MLDDNPCRLHAFEVFQIDKSATDLKGLRLQVKAAREVWAHEKRTIRTYDGRVVGVEEARMNGLEECLSNPLERLKQEEFVHQPHPFAGDSELAAAISALPAADERPVQAGDARTAATGVLGQLLPDVSSGPMADDLPEPERPAPLPIEEEPWEVAILRDF